MNHIEKVLVYGLVMTLAASCGKKTSTRDFPAIASPDQLTLYSIDGNIHPGTGSATPGGNSFRGYPVLGKIEFNKSADADSIVNAVNESMRKSDGTVAMCFIPRHGLRVVRGGVTTDYVICFQCLHLQIHSEGSEIKSVPLTKDAQELLNRHLGQKGIPIAP